MTPKYPNQTAFHQHLQSSDNGGPGLSVTRNWGLTDVQKNPLNVKSSANLPVYWLAQTASDSKWFLTCRCSQCHHTLTVPSLMFLFARLDFRMSHPALLPYGAMKCNSFYEKLYAKRSLINKRITLEPSPCERPCQPLDDHPMWFLFNLPRLQTGIGYCSPFLPIYILSGSLEIFSSQKDTFALVFHCWLCCW